MLLGSQGGGVALFDAATRRRVITLAGHTAGGGATPCGCSFTPDGRFCLSIATGDRSVAIWRVPEGAESANSNGRHAKGSAPAMLRLALPDSWPVQISCACSGDAGAHFLVVAVSHAGEACVWRCQVGEDAMSVTTPSSAPIRIRVGGQAAAGTQPGREGVLAAHAHVEGGQGVYPPWNASRSRNAGLLALFSFRCLRRNHKPRPGNRNAVPQSHWRRKALRLCEALLRLGIFTGVCLFAHALPGRRHTPCSARPHLTLSRVHLQAKPPCWSPTAPLPGLTSSV